MKTPGFEPVSKVQITKRQSPAVLWRLNNECGWWVSVVRLNMDVNVLEVV